MDGSLRWDDLRVFLRVSETESLTAASHGLRMDPATLSRRIARLERDLDARLFLKSPQGYRLTDAGQRLLESVGPMATAVRAAQGAVQGQGERLTGSVRIGAPDGMANFLLPQVCAEICDEHPGLDIQIVALPRVLDLTKREADMALTVSPPTAGRLSVQKVSDYRLHLAADRAYLDRHPPIRSRADLRQHRIIGYIGDLIFDDALDYIAELGEGARVPLSSNSLSVQLNWTRIGAGICIVHDFALPAFPSLTRILTDEISLSRTFYLVRHTDDRRFDRLNQVAGFLVQKIRREIRRLEALA